jgi:hypothetical protein
MQRENSFPFVVDNFSAGLKTRKDRSQIETGACFGGQNVSIDDGDRISNRKNKTLYNGVDNGSVPITSSAVLVTRNDGSTYVYHAGDTLYYRNKKNNRDEILLGGLAEGRFFGFCQSSENFDFADRLHFGNGIDHDMSWIGAHDIIDGNLAGGESEVSIQNDIFTPIVHFTGTASATTTTTVQIGVSRWSADIWKDLFYVRITSGPSAGKISLITANTNNTLTFGAISGLSGTPTFEIRQARFATSGELVINGQYMVYIGFVDEKTFGSCSNVPAANDGDGIAQGVTRYPANPRGNIHKMLDGCRYVLSTFNSTMYRSKVFQPEDFTFGSPRAAGEGDIVDVVDAPGNVTGAGLWNGFIVVTKRDLVKPYRYSQDANDILTSQNTKFNLLVGNEYPGGILEIDNSLFSCVTGKGVRALASTSDVVGGNTANITYDILPTVINGSFDKAATAFIDDRALIAFKSSPELSANDVCIVFNFYKQTWETIIKPGNFSSFFFMDGKMFATSSINREIYALFDTFTETVEGEPVGVLANWFGGAHNMGLPGTRKTFDMMLVEGHISPDAELKVIVDYEYDGFKQSRETTILGSDASILQVGGESPTIGTEVLGVEPLGSTTQLDDEIPRFRVILTTEPLPFYEVSVRFEMESPGGRFAITRYAFNVTTDREHDVGIKKALK